ncbi:hypothetical protein L218DRAFT_951740, partial [Marasmius fiardii PR-910]
VQNNAQGCSTTIVNNYYQGVDSAQQHLNNRGTARDEEAAMVPTVKEVNQVRTCFPSSLPASSAEQGHNGILPPHLPRGGINTNMTNDPHRSTCLIRQPFLGYLPEHEIPQSDCPQDITSELYCVTIRVVVARATLQHLGRVTGFKQRWKYSEGKEHTWYLLFCPNDPLRSEVETLHRTDDEHFPGVKFEEK